MLGIVRAGGGSLTYRYQAFGRLLTPCGAPEQSCGTVFFSVMFGLCIPERLYVFLSENVEGLGVVVCWAAGPSLRLRRCLLVDEAHHTDIHEVVLARVFCRSYYTHS